MSTPTLTSTLKKRLWTRYGSEQYPAEWDGNVMSGGKISQRFWEYLIAIEMLDLPADAKVLDIGGGSTGIFSQLLASTGIQVVVMDRSRPASAGNVTVEECFADRDTLSDALRRHRPTHVACLSVLEHATTDQQCGIFEALEAAFDGTRAVFTFEFHETDRYFEQQVTTQTLSRMVTPLRRYYLERIERAPLHCINAVNRWYPLALQFDANKTD